MRKAGAQTGSTPNAAKKGMGRIKDRSTEVISGLKKIMTVVTIRSSKARTETEARTARSCRST